MTNKSDPTKVAQGANLLRKLADAAEARQGSGSGGAGGHAAAWSAVTLPASQQDRITTVKPLSQNIIDHEIHWEWESFAGVRVIANYVRRSGEYDISLVFDTAADVMTFNSDESKNIGIALLSAVEWEHTWQQHAGEFLAVQIPIRPPTLIEFGDDDES